MKSTTFHMSLMYSLSPTSHSCLISLQMRPVTQARMQDSTSEGLAPLLVTLESPSCPSQPSTSSILCEARMSRTEIVSKLFPVRPWIEIYRKNIRRTVHVCPSISSSTPHTSSQKEIKQKLIQIREQISPDCHHSNYLSQFSRHFSFSDEKASSTQTSNIKYSNNPQINFPNFNVRISSVEFRGNLCRLILFSYLLTT